MAQIRIIDFSLAYVQYAVYVDEIQWYDPGLGFWFLTCIWCLRILDD